MAKATPAIIWGERWMVLMPKGESCSLDAIPNTIRYMKDVMLGVREGLT
jgi:hypothetical protein